MESVIVAVVSGFVTLIGFLAKNGSTSKKILQEIDGLKNELGTQGLDLLQIKLDKRISRYRLRKSITESELKELNEMQERYHKLGGNGYYSTAVAKITDKFCEEEGEKNA